MSDTEEEELLLLWALLSKRKRINSKTNDSPVKTKRRKRKQINSETSDGPVKKKRTKRIWNSIQRQEGSGEYERLCSELSMDEENYYKYFNMSHDSFEWLFDKIEPRIAKMDTNFRRAIDSRERFVVCLRYLAGGGTYTTVSRVFQLGTSTVSKIVRETCKEICEILEPLYLPEPSRTFYEASEKANEELYNFPNCVGCLNAKYVALKCVPKKLSYKDYRVVLLSIIDPWCKFIAIDIGDYGQNSSGLEGLEFYQKYIRSLRNVLPRKVLPRTNSIAPRVFICDDGFTSQNCTLRPHPKVVTYSNEAKKKYNERLKKPYGVVAKTFGLLVNKWKIFKQQIHLDLPTAFVVIKAAICLHNYTINESILIEDSQDDVKEKPPGKRRKKRPKCAFVKIKPTKKRGTAEELKRRLVDDSTPLPKRLCLAKNVINTHHFPTAAKERLIAEWLETLTDENKLSGEELRNVIGWLNAELTKDLKVKLVQVVAKYLQNNPIQKDDVQSIFSFLENVQVTTQLSIQADDYLYINISLLNYLRNEENSNFSLSDKILNNLIKYYKDSKKKYEFIVKILDGNKIETIFSYLDTEIRNTVIALCGNVLFPLNKRSFYITLLKTYIRTDNIDDLIAEKGDNIQSVLKIMDSFFAFPKGRTNNDTIFLKDFIDMFVSCFKKESQLLFAFYIMVCSSLKMEQNYLVPTTVLPPIDFEENSEKVKRNLFLNMLEILLKNEIDIDVRLTDTLGEKISKVETKKTFLLFLQATMMGQLKLEGKLDKATIQIIQTALKLDPSLIDNKIKEILPPIMTAKKNNNVKESYTEMINCFLDILFKLSRGIPFLNKILPLLKIHLEEGNTEQFELRTKVKELADDSKDKIRNKLITWSDILPEECVEMYGKLTSELMFRQNRELLLLLQKDFEETCLQELEEDILNPSTIVLTELLSAILSTFFHYNKMADHTVPLNIAEEFWTSFQDFEDVLKKFGQCVIKHGYEPSLVVSFLKLCHSFSQLKLLNIAYGNTKVNLPEVGNTEVFDFSLLLSFLDGEQWKNICSSVNNGECTEILDKLLLTKIKAIEILTGNIVDENVMAAKIHLIKQISTTPQNFNVAKNYLNNVVFNNLDKNLLKQLSKCLVKLYLSNPDESLFKNEAIMFNRNLLNALVIETCRNITKCLDHSDEISKSLTKSDFDLAEFAKEHNMEEYFGTITKSGDDSTVASCVDILKELQIYYLEEKYQLIAIFVLLALKKCCHKKMRRNIDNVLHNIFELSLQSPDLYKIFPIQFIFSFEDKTLLNLLTLKNKTSNNSLIIKSILESAVKRVRSDSSLVLKIVELLQKSHELNSNKTANIEYFSDAAFQISCIILPFIAKQKKVLTSSAYRSILADLQEKLHKSMLEAFRNIDFKNSSLLNASTGNTDESMVVSENDMVILNAMAAYSLTLSKYCETTDIEEIKNLDCLWSGLEFFVQNAIQSLQKPETKRQHLDTSIQLLNITLRHLKKLESHYIFETKDKILLQIWQSLKSRLFMVQESGNRACLEEIGVTVKFLCEHSDVDCFVNHFVADLTTLSVLEKQQIKKKEDIHKIPTSLKVALYLWTNCLKANITGPKCVAMTKSIYQSCKSAKTFIWQHYENYQNGVVIRRKKKKMAVELKDEDDVSVVKIDDYTCELIRIYLDVLVEGILAAKKITLDYKFLDAIFELQQQVQVILGFNTNSVRCEVAWQSYFNLCQGYIRILNSLLVSREELLEDRWPCYMQCYRSIVNGICERSVDAPPDRYIEEKLSETAHNIEKLTQSMSKRKVHISRISAYTVADMCSTIERTAPPRILRQHIENSVSLLIQSSDTTYSVAFLKRALAGSPGQMTLTNLYTMYKRYHKYTGNA